MDLKADFSFRPLPPIATPIHLPFPGILDPLGPLRDLPGTWTGTGFNTIWRPFFPKAPGGEDEFLELNLTTEQIDFAAISGPIPNRGFLQPDINMFGMTYLQQIKDAVVVSGGVHAGLHIEPGIWATVPQTSNPAEPPTVVRMASIPHGTTILAQGNAIEVPNGHPVFDPVNINPIPVRGPAVPFEQQNLAKPSNFRSPPAQIVGVTQAMVDNPNSVLAAAIVGQTITSMTVLQVSTTAPPPPTIGGGTSNTAFLAGAAAGPNAKTVTVSATFWIEHVKGINGAPDFLQLQYTQTVMLVFDDGTKWPHVTVGTLRKNPSIVPAAFVDPTMPPDLLAKIHAAQVARP